MTAIFRPASLSGLSLLEKATALLRSRRFWAAVAAVAILAARELLGLDEAIAQQISAVIMAWILGDSLKTTA